MYRNISEMRAEVKISLTKKAKEEESINQGSVLTHNEISS